MVRVIDTDSHAVEAPDLWTSRMSKAKWGDDIPRVRWVPEMDADVWFVGDHPIMPVGFSVIEKGPAGEVVRNEENFPSFITKLDEFHPSAWDPHARAKVMEQYGVDSAVLYPNLGFIGPDIYRVIEGSSLEFQVEIASTYNDWIRDWESAEPNRFISLACIPYWDVPSAVAEIERCAENGHHGYVMTGVPDAHGEPFLVDRRWDPMWAAAEATGLPISFHAGGGGGDAAIKLENEEGHVVNVNPLEARRSVMGTDTTLAFTTCREFMRNGMSVAELLMSNILPRFPELRFVSVESGIGWIPFVLESLDQHAKKYRIQREHPEYTELPSFYFHRQVYANVWFEHLTDYHIEVIGADNLLFETDFPHPTCLIGDEINEAIEVVTGGLSQDNREKILWKNAERLFKVNAPVG